MDHHGEINMIYDAWKEILDFIVPTTDSNKELIYIAMILTAILLVMVFKGRK